MTEISVSVTNVEIEALKTQIEINNTVPVVEVLNNGSITINISSSGAVEAITSTENISTHRIVACINNRLELASKDNADHAYSIVGMSISSGSDGSVIFVQSGGVITDESWFWTENLPLWLNVNGEMIQTAPTSGFLIQVGIPIATNKVLIEIQEAILL